MNNFKCFFSSSIQEWSLNVHSVSYVFLFFVSPLFLSPHSPLDIRKENFDKILCRLKIYSGFSLRYTGKSEGTFWPTL